MAHKDEVTTALEEIYQTTNLEELEDVRIRYLGRKGIITQRLRDIKSAPEDKRAQLGQEANQARARIEQAITDKKHQLRTSALEQESKIRPLDLTAPGKGPQLGHLHPVEELQKELIQLFWQLGFSVAEGPEIETDWYCFEALNIPADHPSRDMQDTFYLDNGAIPRTHTSAVQIRYMEEHKPPIRIIAPGKVYRNEDEDATHIWSFRQVEGLVVDTDIALSDLKGTMLYMLKGLFGEDAQLRLRPNYFPYTEPSVEMDGSCMICRGNDKHCKTCKGSGWIELGGAGMVHPQVLRNVGINPAEYSGFAFGFGLERVASIKYQVSDLREFWRPNIQFLRQF